MAEIKNLVKEYIELDNQLAEVNKETKNLRKLRGDLEEKIREYMENSGYSDIKVSESDTLRIKKTKKPEKKVDRKTLVETMLQFVQNHDTVDTVVGSIFDASEDAEEFNVKLVRTKK